jgi:hypothetical protein
MSIMIQRLALVAALLAAGVVAAAAQSSSGSPSAAAGAGADASASVDTGCIDRSTGQVRYIRFLPPGTGGSDATTGSVDRWALAGESRSSNSGAATNGRSSLGGPGGTPSSRPFC